LPSAVLVVAFAAAIFYGGFWTLFLCFFFPLLFFFLSSVFWFLEMQTVDHPRSDSLFPFPPPPAGHPHPPAIARERR